MKKNIHPAEMSRLQLMFRALYYRNFRLFFIGQCASMPGTWIQMTATAWLVWRLEHNAFLLGLAGFVGRIPAFFMTPLAGVFVDRWSRHRLVILTQILSMIQALFLAGLTFSGHITVWQIILLSLLLGFIDALALPARQSFIVQMVDRREDLAGAIALNSSIINGARMLGPMIAGVVIAAVGEGLCFLLNALSFIPGVVTLLMMKVPPHLRASSDKAIFHHLKEGFVYAFGFPPIRVLLLLVALVSLTGASFSQLLPIFAEQILHGGARTQGALASAVGLGALSGAMFLAMRRSVHGLDTLIAWAPAVFGLGLFGLGLSSSLWLTLAIMPAVGGGMVLQMAATNTLLQTIVDDDKRGRVMSFYTMAFMGTIPLGCLLAGSLVHLIGAPLTVIAAGLCCIAGSLSFASKLKNLRTLIHPIYVRKGLLPEVADGLQSAAGMTQP